jgi:TIR domain
MTFTEQATEPFTFFISYRRRDTAPIALLLKYEIEKRIQFVRVLVDVQEIHPGDHFPQRLEQMIAKAHATVILIGQNWMPPKSNISSEVSSKEGSSNAIENNWIVTELQQSYNLYQICL